MSSPFTIEERHLSDALDMMMAVDQMIKNVETIRQEVEVEVEKENELNEIDLYRQEKIERNECNAITEDKREAKWYKDMGKLLGKNKVPIIEHSISCMDVHELTHELVPKRIAHGAHIITSGRLHKGVIDLQFDRLSPRFCFEQAYVLPPNKPPTINKPTTEPPTAPIAQTSTHSSTTTKPSILSCEEDEEDVLPGPSKLSRGDSLLSVTNEPSLTSFSSRWKQRITKVLRQLCCCVSSTSCD